MSDWTTDDAKRLYNIAHWSEGYFDVNAEGHMVAHPRRDGRAVDLHNLVSEVREAGLKLPVLVRFTDILHDRIDTLCDAFAQAREAEGYTGGYTAVYPVKVNQQRRVVEEIVGHGGARVGLEAGSKPELMIVTALSRRDGVIVCNGYKDREYIRLALIGTQLGHRLHIVIEKLSELELVIEASRELGIRPLLGVRVRLSSLGAGKWQNTGGEKAKFGLSSTQLLKALERLREAGLLDTLKLMHFHMGSQIANVRDIQKGMREAARYYAELRRLGAPLEVVDVGGGLGVDYEGSCSRSACSMNYNVREYATDVVRSLVYACAEHDLPHPEIITECGRALTAHHALLITNVIDSDRPAVDEAPRAPDAEAPTILHSLWETLEGYSGRNAAEAYHDAAHWLGEVQDMYTHGVLGLEERAQAERLYFAICYKVRDSLRPDSRAHRELLDELNEKLAERYFVNFSLFQSLPDVWAIDQVFPIVPLHRNDERPVQRVVLEDLTCDSDGRIDIYVDENGLDSTLPLPPYRRGESYLLGIFMIGAYQETLGDIHNLFGDTDAVDVALTAEGHRVDNPEHGDTVEELLRYVHFNPRDLAAAYRAKGVGIVGPNDPFSGALRELEAGLSGYTYLEE